jgi:hypothetical protein
MLSVQVTLGKLPLHSENLIPHHFTKKKKKKKESSVSNVLFTIWFKYNGEFYKQMPHNMVVTRIILRSLHNYKRAQITAFISSLESGVQCSFQKIAKEGQLPH